MRLFLGWADIMRDAPWSEYDVSTKRVFAIGLGFTDQQSGYEEFLIVNSEPREMPAANVTRVLDVPKCRCGSAYCEIHCHNEVLKAQAWMHANQLPGTARQSEKLRRIVGFVRVKGEMEPVIEDV